VTEAAGKQKKEDSNGSKRENQNPSFDPIKSASFNPFYESYNLEIIWVIFNSLQLVLISKVLTVDYMFIELETFGYILMRLGTNYN